MKRYILITLLAFLGLSLNAQYIGLWYEATDYYKLGDSTVTVWGEDTLTNPPMVREILNTTVIPYAEFAGRLDTTSVGISTTYYISATGSDETGDGSIGSPWATIKHAMYNTSNNFKGASKIIYQVGSGTFTFTGEEVYLINQKLALESTVIEVRGEVNTLQSTVNLVQDGTNPFRWNAVGNSWTTDEFKGDFVDAGTYNHPIESNGADYLIVPISSGLTTVDIVELETFLNYGAENLFMQPAVNDRALTYEDLIFNGTGKIKAGNSTPLGLFTISQSVVYCQQINLENISLASSYIRSTQDGIIVPGIGAKVSNCVTEGDAGSGDYGVVMKTGTTTIIDLLINNYDKGLDFDSGINLISVMGNLHLESLNQGIDLYNGASFICPATIYLDDVDYLYNGDQTENITQILDESLITGTPNTAWVLSDNDKRLEPKDDYVAYIREVHVPETDTGYYNAIKFSSDNSVLTSAMKIENVISVAYSGGDYTSIEAAIASIPLPTSITNAYIIEVTPGLFIENNPLQLPKNVTVIGSSLVNTIIVAQNASEDLFLMDDFTEIRGMTLTGVLGSDKYAVRMDSAGEAIIQQLLFLDVSNGIEINNPSAYLNILDCGLETNTETINKGVHIENGNLTLDFIKVLKNSIVDTIVAVRDKGSVVTLNNVQTFSTNVGVAIYVTDTATVSGIGHRIINAEYGILLDGDSTVCQFDAIQIFNSEVDGFKIEADATNTFLGLFATSITGSGNYNFNVASSSAIVYGNGFTEIDKGYIEPGAKFYAYLLDTKTNDEGLNIIGELHVGVPEAPSESALGGGDSYTRQMLVYEYNGGTTTYTNVTDSVTAIDGFAAEFPTTGVNSAIYISTTILDTALHYGIKCAIIDSLTIGAGEVVAEYWDGAAWMEFNSMVTDSDAPFAPRAKAYFEQNNGTHIRYSIAMTQDDVWRPNDPMGLGADHKWVRFRIASAITESCRIDQIKVHPSRLEANADGFIENFGDARNSQILQLNVGAGDPFEGNMQDQTIYVDENVGSGFQQNRFTATGDKLGYPINLPDNIDTGCPVNLVFSGRYVSGGAAQWTIRYRRVEPGQTLYASEPAPSGETVTVIVDATVTAAINEIFSVELDLSEYLSTRQGGFGDQLWISLQPTTLPGSFDITNIGAAYFSWSEGGHY